MKSKFFEAVSRIDTAKGFEDKGVEPILLQLHLNGELAVEVDESGSMLYHPYREWLISLMLSMMPAKELR